MEGTCIALLYGGYLHYSVVWKVPALLCCMEGTCIALLYGGVRVFMDSAFSVNFFSFGSDCVTLVSKFVFHGDITHGHPLAKLPLSVIGIYLLTDY